MIQARVLHWGEAIYFSINSIWCSSPPQLEAVGISGTGVILSFKVSPRFWEKKQTCRKHGRGNHLEPPVAVLKPQRAS